jgi:hypothetical protein
LRRQESSNDWIKERAGLERGVEDIKVVEQEPVAEDGEP